jgi:hypothetical protein
MSDPPQEDLRVSVGRRLFDQAEDFALTYAFTGAAASGVDRRSALELYRVAWETTYFMLHVVDRLALAHGRAWSNALMAVLEPAALRHGIQHTTNLQPGSATFEQAAAEHDATLARRHVWYGIMELIDPFGEGEPDWGYARIAAAAFGRSEEDSLLHRQLFVAIRLRLRDLRLRRVVDNLQRRYPSTGVAQAEQAIGLRG